MFWILRLHSFQPRLINYLFLLDVYTKHTWIVAVTISHLEESSIFCTNIQVLVWLLYVCSSAVAVAVVLLGKRTMAANSNSCLLDQFLLEMFGIVVLLKMKESCLVSGKDEKSLKVISNHSDIEEIITLLAEEEV